MTFQIERAYAHDRPPGGARFLVDRLWPRGVKKTALHLTGWLRDVAPSDRLRRWFGHDPDRWPEFEARYFAELEANQEAYAPLVEASRRGPVTLVFGAKDEQHNNAVALRTYLERAGSRGGGAPARKKSRVRRKPVKA
jgi:uncharacterized protein YeaO (DUF488 family)